MTTKQRAYLKSLAQTMDPLFNIGKDKISPELITAIDEALAKRELVKISILKNNDDDIKETANTVAERTRSTLGQVIGRRFVLYKPAKMPKIELPKVKKA
ncbi:MAG: YhbY family RNA-binding protein [Lachnospiraceae bacterium]|nr:YhbY family RNA-binding protein [Lachnospiraceae bacterium]